MDSKTPPLKKARNVEGEKVQEQGSQCDNHVRAVIFEQVYSSDSFVRQLSGPGTLQHSFLESLKVHHSSETGQPYLRAMNHEKMGESKSDCLGSHMLATYARSRSGGCTDNGI